MVAEFFLQPPTRNLGTSPHRGAGATETCGSCWRALLDAAREEAGGARNQEAEEVRADLALLVAIGVG